MTTSHNHILAAIMFAIVGYVSNYIVWTHLFAGVTPLVGHVMSLTFVSVFALFLFGYVVTYFYQHVTHTGSNFAIMLWLLLISTITIPALGTPVGDTAIIGSLVANLVVAFLGTHVIGRVLNGTLLTVTK